GSCPVGARCDSQRFGVFAGFAAHADGCGGQDGTDEPPGCGAAGDFFGSYLAGSPQDVQGLVVVVAHEEGAGGVEQEGRLAFVDRQLVEVDLAGVVDGDARVAKPESDGDAVAQDVVRAEGGPHVVAVVAEPGGCLFGFVQEFGDGVPVARVGGGAGASQRQGGVDRQVVFGLLGAVGVHAQGCGAGGVGGGAVVSAVHEGVGDDAGAGAGHEGASAGVGGLDAAVGCEPGHPLVFLLEQDGGGDVVCFGGQGVGSKAFVALCVSACRAELAHEQIGRAHV